MPGGRSRRSWPSLGLAISLAYGIVRLALLPSGRGGLALGCALVWSVQGALLVYWCRPSIRRHLRGLSQPGETAEIAMA